MSRRDQIAEALRASHGQLRTINEIADRIAPTVDRLCAEAAAEALEQAAHELRIPAVLKPSTREVTERATARYLRARAAAVNPSKEQQP